MDELDARKIRVHIFKFFQKDRFLMSYKMKPVKTCGLLFPYMAMFLYIGIAIGQFLQKFPSGFTLSIAGILDCIGKRFIKYGTYFLHGNWFTMISGEAHSFHSCNWCR